MDGVRTRVRFAVAPIGRLRASQVNLLLEVLVLGCLATGVVSWAIGTGWAQWATTIHGVLGLSILVIAPAKLQRSVATGLRRRRLTRWFSIAFGFLVVVTVAMGVAHTTGLWFGVGLWSALWVHVAAAVVAVPLFVWHIVARPMRLRPVDVDRRLVVGAAAVVGLAAVGYGVQSGAVRAFGLSRRRYTGSHETASFDPAAMPAVSWLDDTKPSVDQVDDWRLMVGERSVDVSELKAMARSLDATLDCTGGWWSTQTWDVVPLSVFTDAWTTRSVRVTSITGYSRLLPREDSEHLFVGVGYGGRPLERRHGAPGRVVAPGRRGPWWVKWITSIEPDDRHWWLQLPFPPT